MTAAHEIPVSIQGCLQACERCDLVLDAISEEMFAGERPDHRPIGAHLRHALDHIVCFVRGLPEGIVDYDNRDRDEAIERDPELFRKALHESMDALRSISAERLRDAIQIRQTVSLDSEPALLGSTVERELVFLSSHIIHHIALLVQFCREEGVELPEDMALAYSTSAYLKTAAR